ncbi:hypothetical protein AV530_004673 [Patagioenas fasciata monilis]|uniref:Uncharacterized protein n=1 Tax=Patagioenas fasciata monilis TaxID=372326 RepID=A0A1V4KHW1_PATFA|nr:hypothetical protein AV530_004673 [Patagioenas fasciata monilis]
MLPSNKGITHRRADTELGKERRHENSTCHQIECSFILSNTGLAEDYGNGKDTACYISRAGKLLLLLDSVELSSATGDVLEPSPPALGYREPVPLRDTRTPVGK